MNGACSIVHPHSRDVTGRSNPGLSNPGLKPWVRAPWVSGAAAGNAPTISALPQTQTSHHTLCDGTLEVHRTGIEPVLPL